MEINSFETRMSESLNHWYETNGKPETQEQRSAFRRFLQDHRRGDYLIKIGRNNKRNWCGEDQMYIDYSYLRRGWFALSSRKNAQYFSAEEAQEFIKNKKGFRVVKR